MPSKANLGLVMSGGGARGAYQVGFLSALAEHHPDLEIPIITGVSAGAINAAYLASQTASFQKKVDALLTLWSRVTNDQIFRLSKLSLARTVAAWLGNPLGNRTADPFRAHSLVDASPLCAMLQQFLAPVNREFPGIAKNIASGTLQAIAVTASSYSTGQSVTWVQGGHGNNSEGGYRKTVRCRLRLDHILASASLPLFFPAIRIHRRWFGDGGIRMTAPLSPAVHLGADRILAIHTRCLPAHSDLERRGVECTPSPVHIAGTLFDAVFLDVFDNDASRLQRINRLVTHLPPEHRQGLRPIDLKLIRPSMDLGKLAADYVDTLPAALRFMAGGGVGKARESNEALSLVLFHPDYLRAIIALGYKDAEAQMDSLSAFLTAPAKTTEPYATSVDRQVA